MIENILMEIKNGKLSEETMNEVKKEICSELHSIKRRGITELVYYLNTNGFFTSPASTRFHGAYDGGLAVHSLLVYKEFDFLVERYKSDLPADSRKIVGICHDLCKVGVYKRNEVKKGKEMAQSSAKPYNFEDDFPIGHGEKSLWIVGRYIEPTEKEALLIRWHMGSYDGNYELNEESLKKKCPELVLLQSADRIASGWYDV